MIDGLSFSFVNEFNENIVCDILKIIPNEIDSNEPYVLFNDNLLDQSGEEVLQYGKVVKENEGFVLKRIEDENLVERIKDLLVEDIYKMANELVESNLVYIEETKDTFVRKNDLGIDVEYYIIGYYKNYMIYTDLTNDKNDNINIFVDIKESGEYKRLDEESSKNIVIKFNNEILESLKK